MTDHKTGTREEWLAARLELLEAEKALTRRSDELALWARRVRQPLTSAETKNPRSQGLFQCPCGAGRCLVGMNHSVRTSFEHRLPHFIFTLQPLTQCETCYAFSVKVWATLTDGIAPSVNRDRAPGRGV
jgi:hypothetical protein